MAFHTFEKFDSDEAYAYASMIRSWLFDGPKLFFPEDFFDPNDVVMLEKALQPDRKTLLHDFIEACILRSTEYDVHKAPAETIPCLLETLRARSVDVDVESENENDGAYAKRLQALYIKHVLDGVVNSVFNLLFQDRTLLERFGKCIAVRVSEMKFIDYPNALSRDGVLKRCSYWPSWVRGALIMRDKGHCALCQCDISGMLAQDAKIHIDHIVPLALGGTNDLTNLQLLCDGCNLAKGDRSTSASAMVPRFITPR